MFKGLLSRYDITAVFTNHDYEQYAIDRDEEINHLLAANSISFNTYKDQVIFEKNEVVKDDGKPYTVFTPYGKKWKACLNDFYTRSYATEKYLGNFFKQPPIGNGLINECYPPVIFIFQIVQDIPVENKNRNHWKTSLQGIIQRCIIFQPQISPEPHDRHQRLHLFPERPHQFIE